MAKGVRREVVRWRREQLTESGSAAVATAPPALRDDDAQDLSVDALVEEAH